MFLTAFIIGIIIGGLFGILTMCLVQISRVNKINEEYGKINNNQEKSNER